MNVWHSLNAPPPAQGAAGLVEYEILVPDRATLARAKSRVEAAGVKATGDADSFRFLDPWQIPVRMLVARNPA